MIEHALLHAGATRMPLPHAVVDAVVGVGAGLVIVAAFYLLVRFYAGSSESEF
ncbi:MAG: hypothetical protein ABEJ94_00385 [Halorientalis sp.]